jgi:hypothetical protein
MMGVQDNSVVSMRIPFPQGNITVPTSGETCNAGNGNVTAACTPVRLPILWPQTTIVWPCGKGVPSGSAVTSQGLNGGAEYVAYPYATFTNGTKAAILTDCDEGSL